MLIDVVHVVTAMLFVAGVVGRGAAYGRARRSRAVHSIENFMQLSDWFERRLVIPGYFVVLITGLFASWLAGWPLVTGLNGEAPKWVMVSLLLYLSPMLVIPTYLAPRRRQRAAALADALAQGQLTPHLIAALHDRGVLLFRGAELVIFVVVTALMVAKPF